MQTKISDELFERARAVIPGGVNSPVRAFTSVGRNPLFIKRAEGSSVWDADGHEYIDYVGSWGPMILGHAHPRVIKAVKEAAERGTSFGASTEHEVKLAELLCGLVPSVEMVRMVNSGTEATMSAIRLARAFTGREKILKFEGCYHGHGDSFLIKAGSGALTHGVPDSPGVPTSLASLTLTAQFNNLDSVSLVVNENKGEIAAIIVEPIVGNIGCVPPANGFLKGLRDICNAHQIVLIFDEVMTGFRVARGGAQELYGIAADLTTFGKIIGGGLPVGAYGGKRDIMSLVAPMGPVYQAGTLSGNPLAMAAGYETLSVISEEEKYYERLEENSRRLAEGTAEHIRRSGLPVTMNRAGSMFTLFFSEATVIDYRTAITADRERYGSYFRAMLQQGIFLPPSQFEAAFVSSAHSDTHIERTIQAINKGIHVAFA